MAINQTTASTLSHVRWARDCSTTAGSRRGGSKDPQGKRNQYRLTQRRVVTGSMILKTFHTAAGMKNAAHIMGATRVPGRTDPKTENIS